MAERRLVSVLFADLVGRSGGPRFTAIATTPQEE